MAIVNLENPKFRANYADGSPLSLGKVEVFLAGTTTQATTYTDAVRTAQNTNPVILSSGGEAEIWFDVSVDVEIRDASDVLQDKVLGLAANLSPTITGSFNLVQNGSFEIDDGSDGVPDNWSVSEEASATIAIDAVVQAHGQNSLKFDGGGSGGGTATSAKFDVLSSGDLSIQYTYKSSNAGTTNSLQIKWYDNATALISTTTVFNEAAANPTSFTTYNKVTTTPATAVFGEVVLTGVSSGGGQLSEDTWFDDVVVSSKDVTIVTLNDTQTLTAKTLNSPVIDTSISGSAIDTVTLTNSSTLIPSSSVVTTKTANLNTKLFDIGDWNMDTTASVNIAHGLTQSKIRSIQVTIRDDGSTTYSNLAATLQGTTPSANDHTISAGSTTIYIKRDAGSIYNSPTYNSTSFNRGWIVVQYTD